MRDDWRSSRVVDKGHKQRQLVNKPRQVRLLQVNISVQSLVIIYVRLDVLSSNVMLRHSLGGEVIFFLCNTLLLPTWDLMPCFHAILCFMPEVRGIAIKASNSRREQSIVDMKRKISCPILSFSREAWIFWQKREKHFSLNLGSHLIRGLN